MPTDKTLSNLVINRVPTQEIYNTLKEQNLINDDELYLVESGGGADGAINIIKRTIETRASSWTNNGDGTFSQPVVIDDGGVDCIVELQPDDDQILQLISDKTTSLRVDNDEGSFIAVATGAAPSVDLAIQATITGIFEELPELDIIPISRGGTGATTAEEARENLGAAAKEHTHTAEELGISGGLKTYTATIGTTWEEDSETGVKYQTVTIAALTGADDEKAFVDHTDSSIDGTSDGYALFVEEENQYLEFITNGRAETVEGGIRFEIFGDANTIEIPIEVRVG